MLNTDDLYTYLETNKDLSVYHRDKITEDILELQEKLKPFGIIKEDTDVYVLKDKSLIMVLIWQHELFAMKHFMECSKEIPPQTNYWDLM